MAINYQYILSSKIIWASLYKKMLLQLQLVFYLFIAQWTLRTQLFLASLVVSLFVFDHYYFETVITMFEFMFTLALLDIVLEQLWNLDVLITVVARCYKFAFFGQMQIVYIFVFEFVIVSATKFAIMGLFLIILRF